MLPGPLHQNIVEECYEWAIELKKALPKDGRSRISIQPAKTFREFGGEYSDSCKIPDLAIIAEDDDTSRVPRIIFEIGTSESYKHLKTSAKLWLEGIPKVQECILIKVHETPPYRSPLLANINFPAPPQIRESALKSESKYGPVIYKGLRWTGKISKASYEVWTLDPVTKLAIKRGERTDLLMDEKGIPLKLSRLFDIVPDKEIQAIIPAEAIRQQMSRGLIEFGLLICRKALWEHLKAKEKLGFKNKTTCFNIAPNILSPGFSVTKSSPSPWRRLNGGTNQGTKHQAFGPKTHFSLARNTFLRPALAKRTTYQAVPGHASGYNVRLTHEAIQKVGRISSPRNPVRLFGIVSLVLSFGNLGCVH